MDWPGAALLAVTLILYALATAGGNAAVIPGAALLLPAAVLALALFVFIEIRSASPLVPVSILLDRATGSALAMNILVTTVMMSTLVVGPFFLSFSLGLNDALVGLVMAIGPVTAALSGVLAGRVTDRFGARPVLAAGLVEMTLGLVCLALLPRFLSVAGYVAALIVLTPGFQLFLAANNTSVMVAARDDQRGLLSGLLGLSRNLGFMTGASVMATLFAAAVGPSDIVATAPDIIADAFTTTFLVASGLTLLALILESSASRRRRTRAMDVQMEPFCRIEFFSGPRRFSQAVPEGTAKRKVEGSGENSTGPKGWLKPAARFVGRLDRCLGIALRRPSRGDEPV